MNSLILLPINADSCIHYNTYLVHYKRSFDKEDNNEYMETMSFYKSQDGEYCFIPFDDDMRLENYHVDDIIAIYQLPICDKNSKYSIKLK